MAEPLNPGQIVNTPDDGTLRLYDDSLQNVPKLTGNSNIYITETINNSVTKNSINNYFLPDNVVADGFTTSTTAPNTANVGSTYYDTLLQQLLVWNGSAWTELTSTMTAANVSFAPTGNLFSGNVQAAIAELQNKTVPVSGGTMTGPLVLSGAPTASLEATPKVYVDIQDLLAQNQPYTPSGNLTDVTIRGAINELDINKLQVAGGTMTGPLILDADPTVPLEAATKQYVDSMVGFTGVDTQVMFIDGTTPSGDGGFTFNKTTQNLTVANTVAGGNLQATDNVTVGGNVTASGNVSALGRVTADFGFIGNSLTTNGGPMTITSSGANDITLATGTGNINLSPSTHITNVRDPLNPQDAATKLYVDNIASGLKPKAAVDAYSATNISLPTPPAVIDGVVLTVGTRVLVAGQTTQSENGIYVFDGGGLVRATDADTAAEFPEGTFVFVGPGSVGYAATGHVLTSTVTVLGTSPVVFTQFSSSASYTNGVGLNLIGSQFSLADTAVTPATYGNATHVASLTVDQQGRLTAVTDVLINTHRISNGTSDLGLYAVNGPLTGNLNGQPAFYIDGITNSIGLGIYTGGATQGPSAIAIGPFSGGTNQGDSAVAIGNDAGSVNQGTYAVALGYSAGAGYGGAQGQQAIAIGRNAGTQSQGQRAVALGSDAGQTSQGANAIAIGAQAGTSSQALNSIIINATGAALENSVANSLKIAPIRPDLMNIAQALYYDVVTNEITYAPPAVDPRFLSPNSVNPTTRDPDGSGAALQQGDIYYNTTTRGLRVCTDELIPVWRELAQVDIPSSSERSFSGSVTNGSYASPSYFLGSQNSYFVGAPGSWTRRDIDFKPNNTTIGVVQSFSGDYFAVDNQGNVCSGLTNLTPDFTAPVLNANITGIASLTGLPCYWGVDNITSDCTMVIFDPTGPFWVSSNINDGVTFPQSISYVMLDPFGGVLKAFGSLSTGETVTFTTSWSPGSPIGPWTASVGPITGCIVGEYKSGGDWFLFGKNGYLYNYSASAPFAAQPPTTSTINAMYKTASCSIILGTDGPTLLTYTPGPGWIAFNRLTPSIPGTRITSLASDGTNLVIGTDNGVVTMLLSDVVI